MQRPRRTKFIKYVFLRALPFPRNVVSMKLLIVLAIQVDEIRVNLFPNPEILVSHGNSIKLIVIVEVLRSVSQSRDSDGLGGRVAS